MLVNIFHSHPSMSPHPNQPEPRCVCRRRTHPTPGSHPRCRQTSTVDPSVSRSHRRILMPDHDTRTDENTIDDLKAGQGAREGSAEPGAAGPLPGQPRRGPNRTKADLTKVSANFVN